MSLPEARRPAPMGLLLLAVLAAPAPGQMIRRLPPVDAMQPAPAAPHYPPPSEAVAGSRSGPTYAPGGPAASTPPAGWSPWAPAYVPPSPRYAGPAPVASPRDPAAPRGTAPLLPPAPVQPPLRRAPAQPGPNQAPPVWPPPAWPVPRGPQPPGPQPPGVPPAGDPTFAAPGTHGYPPRPERVAVYPGSTAEMLRPPGGLDPAQIKEPPAGLDVPEDVRSGFFQKLIFANTYLPRWGDAGFGINELELSAFFALPCPKVTSPLLIIPGFAVQYLDGPRGVDLPPRIYAAYTEFRWMSQVRPRLGVELSITPGVFTDFEQDAGKAFRMPGHAAAAWTWNDTTKIVFGAAYLDRPDIEVIPIGGAIWKPYEDAEFEILFPHPKLAHRVYWFGQYGHDVQDWLYLAAEFASEAWTLSHADGSIDEAVLRDYRLILGMERRVIGGLDARIELAYAFGREIRFFRSDQMNFDPNDTVMVRLKLLY